MARLIGIVGAVLVAALLLVIGGLLSWTFWASGGAPVAAQSATPIAASGQRAITVVGQGEASAQPDRAWATVGVATNKPTAAEAMAATSQTTEAVLAKLDELGIPREAVQTSGVNLYPVQDNGPKSPEGGEPTITGYQAVNSLTVRIDDLGKVGAVLDGAVQAGANQVGGVRFGLQDDSALRAQALDAALKSARPKAEAMAAALNLTVGDVLVIDETGSGVSGVPVPGAVASKGGGPPIEGGQLSLSVSVQVTFALTPAP